MDRCINICICIIMPDRLRDAWRVAGLAFVLVIFDWAFHWSFTNGGAVNNSSPSLYSSATSATSSPTSSSSTQFPVVQPLQQPGNDCEAIGPQYTIHNINKNYPTVQFNVSCNIQFEQGDFMSFYSPSITTCMHGCAMFNYLQTVYNNHK